MHEAGWGAVILLGLLTLAIIRIWGWVDGTDAWDRKRKKEWASTKEN